MDRSSAVVVHYLKRHMTYDQLSACVDDGVSMTGPWGLRRWVAERDVEAFVKLYFPEEFYLPFANIHESFISDIAQMRSRALAKVPGLKLARAVPRGHSKSSFYSRVAPIHGYLYGWSPLTILLGNNHTAADRLVKNIRDELTTNELLIEDFPDVQPEVWQTSHLQSKSGCTIRSFGVGSGAVRGVSRPGQRPSLIIGDDLDDDQSARSAVQLASNLEWFTKAVLQLGDQVTFTTSYVIVGTIIRSTSLMSHIIEAPDFAHIIEKGVLAFSGRQDLWDAWREWFIEEAKAGRKPVDPAHDAFYQAHRDDMLADTAVLWDRPDAYYTMMLYRLSSGEQAFWSEVMNQPNQAGGAMGRMPTVDVAPTASEGWELIGSLDPTTKGGKSNDLAAWTEAWFHRGRKEVVLTYLDSKQRPYGETIDTVAKRIKAMNDKGHRYAAIFCEANSAGEVIANTLNEELDRRGIFQTVTKVNNSAPKDDRIGLLSHFAGRRQFFVAGSVDQQFGVEWYGYPSHRFDDSLDSAATIVYQLKDLGLLDLLEPEDDGEELKKQVAKQVRDWAEQNKVL
jgi:hypothetical protein